MCAVGIACNAQLGPRLLGRWARPDDAGRRLLERAAAALGLSARAYHRILRVARTIADLDGDEQVRGPHIAEAISYRMLDRREASAAATVGG
jgi:magnesium chelatase family protein